MLYAANGEGSGVGDRLGGEGRVLYIDTTQEEQFRHDELHTLELHTALRAVQVRAGQGCARRVCASKVCASKVCALRQTEEARRTSHAACLTCASADATRSWGFSNGPPSTPTPLSPPCSSPPPPSHSRLPPCRFPSPLPRGAFGGCAGSRAQEGREATLLAEVKLLARRKTEVNLAAPLTICRGRVWWG